MLKWLSKWTVCVLSVMLASGAYAQSGKKILQAGRALVNRPGSYSNSSLKVLENWHNIGAAAKLPASVQRAVTAQVRTYQETPDHAFRNSGFFGPITPTPTKALRINLIHPTTEQVQESLKSYRALMRDFEDLRKEVCSKLLYTTLPNDKWGSLSPQERRPLITALGNLRARAQQLRRVVFADDVPLGEVVAWLDQALQKVNPFYVPEGQRSERSDKRKFDRSEFLLKDPDWRTMINGPERKLSPNLHVAVLNDQKNILEMYHVWEQQGRLGEGWRITTYEDTRPLIQALQNGTKFDLIITDITVPVGGGYFLVDKVREMGWNMPVIGCSMYTVDKINAQKMFDQGFDGYIYGDDMFEEEAGSVTMVGYLKNYYYYKALHGWSR